MTEARRRLRLLAFVTASLAIIAFRPGAAAAASCSGQSHDLALTSGAASPGSGTTATSFQFSVTYADNAGCAPTVIVVLVDGAGTFPLTFTSGDLTSGATFARSMTLPVGTHGYHFEAVSGSGAGERTVVLTSVAPGTVTVTSSAPKPTPVPTPPPPAPTPAITAPPPTPGDTPTPAASASAAPPAGSQGAGASPGAGGTTDPNASGPPGGSAAAAHVLVAGPPGSRSTGASALITPPAEETAAPAAAIPDTGSGPLQELAVAGLGTVVGLGLFMLLALRLLGTGISLRPLPLGAARTTRASPEESVEVWAAPSLPAATIAPAFDDEVTNPFIISRDPMRFTAPPAAGVDRCRVVSRLVALRREPDEMSWPNPERLDVGDEVDVIRQDGPYCYVRTPVGMEGWVPGLTLSGVKAPDSLPGADDGS